MMVGIESALAVDAVEAAHLAVARQKVDTKRHAETPAMYWSEDGGWIYYSTHKLNVFFECKGNENYELRIKN